MADLTLSDPPAESPGPNLRIGHPIANAVQTFAGAFAALAGNLAGANQGFAIAGYDNLVGVIPLGGGWSDEALGDNTATPQPENNVRGAGRILKRVAVTGVVSNAADLGKVVFADSNGPPLLLADPLNALPFGVILDVTGTAQADVWQFSFEAACILGLLTRTVFDSGVNGGDFTSWGTDVGNP